jgi:hypothetical protein
MSSLPLDISLNHLTQGHIGPGWDLCIRWSQALHENASPWHKLPNDTTCLPKLHPGFLGPNLPNCLIMVLRPKPPNTVREVYPLCLLHNLDVCHCPSLTTQSWSPHANAWHCQLLPWLGQHGLCRLLIYTCSSTSPSASHPRSVLAPQSLGSRLHVYPSSPLVHLHELAWPYPLPQPSQHSTPAPCTHHKQRDMLHNTTLTHPSQAKRHVAQLHTHSPIASQETCCTTYAWCHP